MCPYPALCGSKSTPDDKRCEIAPGARHHGEQALAQPLTRTVWEAWAQFTVDLGILSHCNSSRVLLLSSSGSFNSFLRSPDDSGPKLQFSSPEWVLGLILGPIFWQVYLILIRIRGDPAVLWLDKDGDQLWSFPIRPPFKVFCLISLWPGLDGWPRGRGWAWLPRVSLPLTFTAHFGYP